MLAFINIKVGSSDASKPKDTLSSEAKSYQVVMVVPPLFRVDEARHIQGGKSNAKRFILIWRHQSDSRVTQFFG